MRIAISTVVAGAILASALSASAGKRETEILQSDVDELQRQVFELKRLSERQSRALDELLDLLGASSDTRQQWAELNANIDSLRTELRSLGTRFEGAESRLEAIDSKLDRRPAVGRPREASVSEPGPVRPSNNDSANELESGQALYNQAYADYLKDSFALAVSAFREFVARHPNSTLADNAQYWVAMSFFNQRDFASALEEFDSLLDHYPRADNAAEAAYRKGIALRELDRLGQAVLVFNDIVSRHPNTPAARQAKERLRELASGGR